jgi:hypothetical protein
MLLQGYSLGCMHHVEVPHWLGSYCQGRQPQVGQTSKLFCIPSGQLAALAGPGD